MHHSIFENEKGSRQDEKRLIAPDSPDVMLFDGTALRA